MLGDFHIVFKIVWRLNLRQYGKIHFRSKTSSNGVNLLFAETFLCISLLHCLNCLAYAEDKMVVTTRIRSFVIFPRSNQFLILIYLKNQFLRVILWTDLCSKHCFLNDFQDEFFHYFGLSGDRIVLMIFCGSCVAKAKSITCAVCKTPKSSLDLQNSYLRFIMNFPTIPFAEL